MEFGTKKSLLWVSKKFSRVNHLHINWCVLITISLISPLSIALGRMMSKSLLLFCSLFFISRFPLLSSSFSFSFSNSTKLCPHHQTLALLHLKQSFSINNSSSSDCHYNGVMSYPKTESWKKGIDCCSWDGVAYDKVTSHVIGLDLNCSWLFGIIHSNSTLFLFPHLRRLNLASNDFNGSSVSVGFGRFSTLTRLNLSYSIFSRKIAPEIFHLSNLFHLICLGIIK